jgi:hypothetical protein
LAQQKEVSPETQEALLVLLRTKGLSIRDLDAERREQLREFMEYLHVTKGMSLTDIAKLIGNKTSGYTSWLCRQLGVQARPFEEARLKGIREKRRKYERRPFDGTDEDRAYLLGLKHGDLTASKPWKGVVRVSTSTTHPAMVKLFRSLFEPYGHVYQHPRYKKDTKTYEWNLYCIVDESFGFLLMSKSDCWRWVEQDKSRMICYLAGVLDAEGSIGIWANGAGTALQVIVYNTNLEFLGFCKSVLGSLGYSPLGPYLDKRKGTMTSKYKIPRRKDYYKIALAIFEEVQSLIKTLPIRHDEKVRRKELALSLAVGESWTSVEPRVRILRKSIIDARDSFVKLAEETYLSRRKAG